MGEEVTISSTGMDALGFIGGGMLALSLVPQIIKLLLTRSAHDISLLWSILYLLGSTLSLVYLIFVGALAAWVPVVIEVLGCLITITLKLVFDHTSLGAVQHPQQLEEAIKAGSSKLVLDVHMNETGAATGTAPSASAAAAGQRGTFPGQQGTEKLPWYSQPGISHTMAIPPPQPPCCHVCGTPHLQQHKRSSLGTVSFSSVFTSIYNSRPWGASKAGSKGGSNAGESNKGGSNKQGTREWSNEGASLRDPSSAASIAGSHLNGSSGAMAGKLPSLPFLQTGVQAVASELCSIAEKAQQGIGTDPAQVRISIAGDHSGSTAEPATAGAGEASSKIAASAGAAAVVADEVRPGNNNRVSFDLTETVSNAYVSRRAGKGSATADSTASRPNNPVAPAAVAKHIPGVNAEAGPVKPAATPAGEAEGAAGHAELEALTLTAAAEAVVLDPATHAPGLAAATAGQAELEMLTLTAAAVILDPAPHDPDLAAAVAAATATRLQPPAVGVRHNYLRAQRSNREGRAFGSPGSGNNDPSSSTKDKVLTQAAASGEGARTMRVTDEMRAMYGGDPW